ncbi:hypothetical protein [uncultured Celeribacter sp.]|uniref:hypothetical protein n=1 Tax=uncultured Celeribacter sp. TaxID=1303376 RepID=UPI002AA7A6B0|nr:hypothetical protein [uncultured Celeribacter sp.]
MSITTNIWTSMSSDRDIAQAMADDLDFAANVLIAVVDYLDPAQLAPEFSDNALEQVLGFFKQLDAAATSAAKGEAGQ